MIVYGFVIPRLQVATQLGKLLPGFLGDLHEEQQGSGSRGTAPLILSSAATLQASAAAAALALLSLLVISGPAGDFQHPIPPASHPCPR